MLRSFLKKLYLNYIFINKVKAHTVLSSEDFFNILYNI